MVHILLLAGIILLALLDLSLGAVGFTVLSIARDALDSVTVSLDFSVPPIILALLPSALAEILDFLQTSLEAGIATVEDLIQVTLARVRFISWLKTLEGLLLLGVASLSLFWRKQEEKQKMITLLYVFTIGGVAIISLLTFPTVVWIKIILLILAILVRKADEVTDRAETQRQVSIDFLKEATRKVKLLMDEVTHKELQQKLETLYDDLNVSSVRTTLPDYELENQIYEAILALEQDIQTTKIDVALLVCSNLSKLIKERNSHR